MQGLPFWAYCWSKKESKVKFSVVILNYNVKYFLDACLQSVQKAVAGKDAEIIVADNHSTDGSKTYFEEKYGDVQFLWFQENLGFAKAYNRAVQSAKGEYLLILNPDTLVAENFLDVLENFAATHPDFGIIGGKMIDGTGHFLPESKRGIPTPIVAFSKLTKLYKLLNFKPFNKYYALHLGEDQTGEVAILTGALMFIKKQTYLDVGGFDEQYFMYGEDIDLSYSVLQTGKKNYYLPQAKIIHFKGESTAKDDAYYKRFFDTTFQFYKKHFRSFPVQEFLMKSIFKLWLKTKIKKATKLQKQKHFTHTYTIVGSESKNEDKSIIQISKTFKINDIEPNSLLIFDVDTLHFSDIIEIMEKHRNKHLRYRFKFQKSGFIIGSDTKDQLGSVEMIKELNVEN